MSRFAPVFLPEDRKLNGKASQTFLRHFNGCPRSGYLYALHKGEASTVEMVRGSAGHAVFERGTLAALEQREKHCPPDVAKAILDEVLVEYHVPFEEHDYLRESAHRWARDFEVDPPEQVVAVETLFVLEVEGWEIRMKIDYAALRDGGASCYVADYKTGRGAPSFEDVARRRPDATFMAKNFQLVLYALGLAYGVPVRLERCPTCEGTGYPDPGCAVACTSCRRGLVEIQEPFPVAARPHSFDLEFIFPGVKDKGPGGDEDRMLRRPVSVTKLELEEYRGSLTSMVRRLAVAEETGDWPAQVSDQACAECPARPLCPIPVELRDHRGTINSLEEAREAAERLAREKADHAARRKELKNFAKAHEVEIRFGKDKVARFVEAPRTETDREGLIAAAQRAAAYGEAFDPSDFVRVRTSTNFVDVTLSEDELAAEAAGESEGRDER